METGELILLIFFVHVVSGIACAVIALERGVKAGGWFFLGFLLNLLAVLFVSIALPNPQQVAEDGIEKGTHKKCDYCAEVVKAEAVKCRYCHSPLEAKVPRKKNPTIRRPTIRRHQITQQVNTPYSAFLLTTPLKKESSDGFGTSFEIVKIR